MIRFKRVNKIFLSFDSFKRTIYSTDKIWPKEYNNNVATEIEDYWKPILVQNHKEYSENTKLQESLPKKYILSMFPYPSGRLHMGHVRVYTLSDVIARFYRSMGFYVLHPIGWDAFGLPAENAAIDRNVKPDEWTHSNINYMKKQLLNMSFSFDWNREIFTCEKSYYKWTQYFFLKLYEKGLAYQDESTVFWDPVDKTVLAFEQIDEKGNSWRSGAKVEKKYLKQWFIKSTYFTKSLLEGLEELNSEDWEVIKKKQRNWIGNIDGCFIDFTLTDVEIKLGVFTKKPYGIFGLSHIYVSKNNILIDKFFNTVQENEQLPCFAIHPLTKEKIPIFLKSELDYGLRDQDEKCILTSKLGIPSFFEYDKEFAEDKNLKYIQIVSTENEKLKNSEFLNNCSEEEAFKKVTEKLRDISAGGILTNEKLRDWVVSRQRYWGAPCPIIYCEKCKVVPVPYEDLPVVLPKMEKISKKGLSQLKDTDWFKTKCPKCHGDATRETDTLDTFVDSSWYYLRYFDVQNETEPFDSKLAAKFMPVDVYIGGEEHAITHLFVARLISHFLHNQNKLVNKEPFQRFISIGMVKGESFKTKKGEYVEPNFAVQKGNKYFHKETNEELKKTVEKMSKSKLNGIDPEDVISKYGIDFTRLFILSYVNPRSERNFSLSEDMINGTSNMMQTIWLLVGTVLNHIDGKAAIKAKLNISDVQKLDNELFKIRNSSISMLTYNLMGNFNIPSYIVSITKIIKFLRTRVPIELLLEDRYLNVLIEILIMIAPTIPHFSNECWAALKHKIKTEQFDKSKLINEQKWPLLDENYLLDLNYQIYNSNSSTQLKITAKQMLELDVIKALELLKQHENYNSFMNNKDIDSYTFSIKVRYPYNASLMLKKKTEAKKSVKKINE